MKQKRKVKSLIPQKKFTSKSLKTAGLVFLGSALYLASITLLSTSVAFGANDGAQAQDFEEFDWNSPITDKKEVVYAARFATIDKLNKRIIDIFMNKDGVLYITPNPVIVNPLNEHTNNISTSRNGVEEGVYGHILGGDNNKVYSNNVTIIAGEENEVNTGSDNATMLGGEKNTINQGIGVPSAIIGGSENTIDSNHNGSNVIIGGNNNTIKEGVSGSAILGGESNTIENNTANAIIGGSNVTNEKNNVFAYSNNGNFKPENPNSFFLNMKKGVGINMEASDTLNGLYVSGAVSLGDIDIKSKPCDSRHSGNYGLEGKYDGCLVGCTIDGWKMFDRGAKCEEICKDNLNYFGECPRDAEIPDSPDDYTAFCTGLANTDNATQCPGFEAQMQNYKNVVFETKLVDNGKCPESEDKCIFQCKTGFHLTGLITNGYNSSYEYKKCYEDCYYPWDFNKDGPQVPTNTIITGYNRDSVFCSSHEPDDSPKHDHCGNHKQTLICYSGQRYDYNKDQNTRSSTPNRTHKYETCETKEYTCLSSYGLTKYYIINDLRENDSGKTWNTGDRSTTTLTRGKYKLCLDYKPQDDNDTACVEKDKGSNPHTEHYKFVGCNEPDYYEFKDKNGTTRCMKSCTFNTYSGLIRVKHNESTGLYLSDNTTCPTPCEEQTFTCNDGKRENKNGKSIDDYKYTSCNLNSQGHEGYDISENDYNKHKNNFTTYDHINISVRDGDIFSCKGEIRYKITGCADGYHLSSTLRFCTREATRGECGGLPDNYERTSQDQEPFHDGLLGDIDRSKGSTRGKNFRIGTWDNRQYEPDRDKCTKDCIEGYEKRNGQCVKDGKCDLYNINQCSDGGNSSNESTSDGNHLWRCEGDGGKTAYCHICADGYSWEGTDDEYDPENKVDYCKQPEPDEDGECKNYDTSNESRADKDFDSIANELKCKHGTSEIAQGSIHNGYSWLCKKSGNGSDSELCHKCEPGYTWDPNEGDDGDCVEGNGGGEPVNGKCNTGTTINNRWPQNDKDLCTEGEPKNKYGPNDNKYTWDCIGTGGGTSENGCFRCKNGTILSGNKCVNPTTNAKCGTNSNGKYFTSEAHLMNTNNLCDDNGNHSPVSLENNQFKWTCSDNLGSVPCSATKLTCGNSSGQSFTDESQITNKCAPSSLNLNPTVNVDEVNNRFKWTCTKGDASIKCSANKTNTVCKNKLTVKPNGGKINNNTSEQTYEQDCNSNINITTQKNDTTTTSNCYVYFYKDSSDYDRKSATITGTTKWSFNKRTTGDTCGALTNTQYKFPANSNGTTCTITALWKSDTTTYTTGTITVPNVEANGKIFLGWYDNANGGNLIINTGTTSYQPKICGEELYAHWRDAENGQCYDDIPYGCMNSGNTIGYITRIKSGGKDIGVKWKCKGNDGRSDTCEFKCTGEGEIFSGNDTLHNGACVKEELECSGGDELPAEAYVAPTKDKYVYNATPSAEFTEWYYVDSLEDYNRQEDKSCSWTCADGYKANSDRTECIKDNGGCGDLQNYSSSPWMYMDRLCADGWSVYYKEYREKPRISWGLNNNHCEPTFKWKCKKNGTTNKIESCQEEQIAVAYVEVGKSMDVNGREAIYLKNLINRSHNYLDSADEITARMYYYNSIPDGPAPYNCGYPQNRLTYDLTSQKINVSIFDTTQTNTIGWKVENFEYFPKTYTINNTSYILGSIRGVDTRYTNAISNNCGTNIQIFNCGNDIYFD